MLKYLFLIILGILLYILLNRKDRFSIGIPDEAEIQSLIDDINRILGERGKADETDTENLDRLSGYLEGLTDDEFVILATSLDDDDKKLQYFLDVRKYIKIGYGIEQLYAYYTNTGVTLEELQSEELGIVFSDEVWSSPDGKYSIYKAVDIKSKPEILFNIFKTSGDIKETYAIYLNKDVSIYYFFENIDEILYMRGRMNIYKLNISRDKTEYQLHHLTIFPVGHGLGDHFFRILADKNIQIDTQDFKEISAKRAYRRLYHLSVTPKDYGGFSDNGYFTIFRPDESTTKRLYGTLYDGLGKLKSEYTHNQKCLFLMSIDSDDIEDLVENIEEEPEDFEVYVNGKDGEPISEKVEAYQQSLETSSGVPATGCSA